MSNDLEMLGALEDRVKELESKESERDKNEVGRKENEVKRQTNELNREEKRVKVRQILGIATLFSVGTLAGAYKVVTDALKGHAAQIAAEKLDTLVAKGQIEYGDLAKMK